MHDHAVFILLDPCLRVNDILKVLKAVGRYQRVLQTFTDGAGKVFGCFEAEEELLVLLALDSLMEFILFETLEVREMLTPCDNCSRAGIFVKERSLG